MALGTTNTKLLHLTGGRCGGRRSNVMFYCRRSKTKRLTKRRTRKIPTSRRKSRSRSRSKRK